jgi:hypothetical protein
MKTARRIISVLEMVATPEVGRVSAEADKKPVHPLFSRLAAPIMGSGHESLHYAR